MTQNELTDDDRGKIIDSLMAGKKIQAIKQYREVTGTGLKDAKEFIEELTQALSEEHPDIIKKNQASGCAGVVY